MSLYENSTESNLKVSNKQLVKISKYLSLVLRHKPHVIDLTLDPQGWAYVSELIAKSSLKLPLTEALIKQVVATNNKQRFSLSDNGQRIRANQGHSIKVDLNLSPKEPPPTLYHGTATRFLSSILKEGLRRGRRHHVHLSKDRKTATAVGQRHGKPIVLQVASGEMHQQGFEFFLSENCVWLTEIVPPAFLSALK